MKDMCAFVAITLSLWMVATSQDLDHEDVLIGPDRIEEVHACVGTTAYIPWPLDVISRDGHTSTVITLSFQRRHSEKSVVLATFNGRRELKPMIDRLSVSMENSGIYLKNVDIFDHGLYIAQARYSNNELWTRITNLTVHMRPIVINNKLNMSQSEVMTPYNKRSHCVNMTCGRLEYAGYPPVKFVWAAPSKILDVKVARDDSSSSVQICSPFSGDVTCSIAGYSSICTVDHLVKWHLDLPGPLTNSSSVHDATVTRDLVLMIVMPILAVTIPVTILVLWLLRHFMRSHSHYRGQDHYGNRKPDDVDVEDNVTTEQTPNNGDESDGGESQTERKEAIDDEENDDESENENNNEDHNPHAEGEEREEQDEDRDGEEEDEESEDDSGSSDEDNKVNEEQPLMEDSISPDA